MITVTYQSAKYDPALVEKRYVGKGLGKGSPYRWAEVGADRRYDIRQGTCDAEDLPEDLRRKCDMSGGFLYATEWPL
jgi:hypothetical protein